MKWVLNVYLRSEMPYCADHSISATNKRYLIHIHNGQYYRENTFLCNNGRWYLITQAEFL